MRQLLSAGAAFACVMSPMSSPSRAQAAPIAGFMNPSTGGFRPYIVTAPSSGSRSGTFVFTVSATIASTFPSNTKISCSGSANLFDSAGDSDQESAAVAATVSGRKLTCTVTLPYEWTLAETSGQVMLSVEILATTAGQVTRLSTQSLPSIPVPANGATTMANLSTTI